jgi:thiol:disulfide interchange protein
MAQTNYRSAVTMPKALLAAAIALTFGRGLDLAVQAQAILHPNSQEPVHSAIDWLQLKSVANNPQAPQRPPEPEISPAVQKELDGIQSKANTSRKILLYQFYASWSDPCKVMEKTSLQNGDVARVIDKDFLPVRVRDMQHEKGRNDALTNALYKKYRVFAFPTLVAVHEDGEQIGCLVGNCSSLTTYRFLTRTISSQATHLTNLSQSPAL